MPGGGVPNDTTLVERLTILRGGNVGIANTNPQYTLDVCNNGTIRTGELRLTGNTSGYGALKIQGGSAENLMLLQDVCTTIGVPGNADLTGWFFGSKNNLYGSDPRVLKLYRFSSNAAASSPALTVNAAGNIGIGLSNASYPLDVSTTVRINQPPGVSGSLQLVFANGGQTIRHAIGMRTPETGSGNTGSDLQFYSYNDDGSFLRVPIHISRSSGNVGINATSPTKTLDICGSARASSGFEGPGTIPIGGIIMWSGATVPSGWQLCDGTNGTPNLRDKFIIGSGSTYTTGNEGGASNVTLNISNIPPHRHIMPQFYTNSATGSGGISYFGGGAANTFSSNGNIYNSANTLVTAEGSNPTSFSILPPYYALAFIMRMT
jgi:microcystin-dependent protein